MPKFIAEIKTRSPFGFVSEYDFAILTNCAIEHGDWISVHDNALWGGDYESISFVRRLTDKPILAKGLHHTDDDIRRALDHGATYVLVVDRVPEDFDLFEFCLFEWNSFSDYDKRKRAGLPSLAKQKHVSNSRNLKTGLLKTDESQKYIDAGIWVCQASNIANPSDVKEGVSAYLVGQHLVEFCGSKRS